MEESLGGEKYNSINPSVTISYGTDEDLDSKEIIEISEDLNMANRTVVKEFIKQRKEELQGDRDEDDFLKDAKKAWERMNLRAAKEGREHPQSMDRDHISPPLYEREDN